MPYEISLDTDADRGLDRYTISVRGRLEMADARELGDWLAAASQNPTATFTIDLSEAAAEKEGTIARLLARSAWLRKRGRVELVRGARAGYIAALVPLT
jgi:hypothetical protein